jgi:hypothetical protein
MATKNSTGRRARKAKRAAAAPAGSWRTSSGASAPALPNNPQAAPALLPNYHSLLNGLFNVKGVVRLAAAAVYANMDDKPSLQDADGGLTLALREVERIYALLDEPAVRRLWETKPSREEESDDE